jgi:hypothetical protein
LASYQRRFRFSVTDRPQLDNEVAGQIFGLDLATLFLPKPDEGGFIVTHEDPGVGTPMG